MSSLEEQLSQRIPALNLSASERGLTHSPKDEMERHLCRGTNTKQDISADQDRDSLGGCADDATDDTDNSPTNEEVSSAKYVAQSAQRSEKDGERDIVDKGNPGISGIGSNIVIDQCEKRGGISLPAKASQYHGSDADFPRR